MDDRATKSLNQHTIKLIRNSGKPFKTITADNCTELHGHKELEEKTKAEIYFATPYHSWERGTSENTNGLIRQYLKKGTSMAHRSAMPLLAT